MNVKRLLAERLAEAFHSATGETVEQLLDDDSGWASAVFPPRPEGDYRVRLSSPAVDAPSVTDTFVTFDPDD